MLNIPSHPAPDSGRDLDAEREDLYDAMTRRITIALDVYAEASSARRGSWADASDLDGPPGTIDVDAVLGFAVDLLRGAGDEPLAWLLVECLALRGGPPAKVMEAIIAMRTLHKGGPPPLLYTARAAATAGQIPDVVPRPTIVPTGPTWGSSLFPRPGRGGDRGGA